MNESDNETPNQDNKNALSPEQETRCNRDLRTISSLSQALEANILSDGEKIAVVVGGGYATEAHCGGAITRPHGDIDLTVYSPTPVDKRAFAEQIGGVLGNEEHYTHWREHPSQHEELVEFREADKELIPFIERRRLEAEIYHDVDPASRYVRKKLIDSEGKEYEVNVTRLSYLVAEKIQKLFEVASLPEEERQQLRRQTKPADLADIKRLIDLPDFTEREKRHSLGVIGRRMDRKNPEGSAPTDPNTVFDTVVAML